MKKLVHFVIFIIILVCLSSCNANFEDKIHSWDDGTVVKKSTCCSHGQIMYKCQFCEGTKVRELPISTEHNYTKFIYSSSLGLCMSCNECGHLEKILSRTTPDASVLYFDEDVKTIDSSLIDYLEDLEEVVIPVSVETIEKDAFLQNPNLTKITYQGTAEQWTNLNKEDGWDNGLNITSVECSDDSICIHDLVLVETKEATCTEAGTKKYSCKNCDYTKTETIAATGHTIIHQDADSSTCVIEHWSCSECSKNFSDANGTSETQSIYSHGTAKTDTVMYHSDRKSHDVCSICGAMLEGETTLTKASVKNVLFSDSVALIYNSAFKDYTGLTSVVIPDTVRGTYGEIFRNCTNLISVTFPNNPSFKLLHNYVLFNCRKLESITIPSSVTNINVCALALCTSLKTINYGGTTAQWASIVASAGTTWNQDVPATCQVICSDGTVYIDGSAIPQSE